MFLIISFLGFTYVEYYDCSTSRNCPRKKTVTLDHEGNFVMEKLHGLPHTCIPLTKCELPLGKDERDKLEQIFANNKNAKPAQVVRFTFSWKFFSLCVLVYTTSSFLLQFFVGFSQKFTLFV